VNRSVLPDQELPCTQKEVSLPLVDFGSNGGSLYLLSAVAKKDKLKCPS